MRHHIKTRLLTLLAATALVACMRTGNQKSKTNRQETRVEQTVSQGDALLNILNANQQSLVVLNNDSLSYYNGRGVSDLLALLTEAPDRLKDAVVADKMVGRAAAVLMAAAGVREVHTNIISTPALQVLREAGIPVFFDEEVPQILNRDRTGQCPIDALLNEADNVEECVAILKARFQN